MAAPLVVAQIKKTTRTPENKTMSLTTEEEIEERRKQDEARMPSRDDARWLRDHAREMMEAVDSDPIMSIDRDEFMIDDQRMVNIAYRIDDLWNLDLAALLADRRRQCLQYDVTAPRFIELQEKCAHLERALDLANDALKAEQEQRVKDRVRHKEKLHTAGLGITKLLKSDAVLGDMRRALDVMRQKMQIMVTNSENMVTIMVKSSDLSGSENQAVLDMKETAADFTKAVFNFDAIVATHNTAGDEYDRHVSDLLVDNNRYVEQARAAEAREKETQELVRSLAKENVALREQLASIPLADKP